MSDIPKSFTASVDRPFDPVSVRLLTTQLYDRNNQRLSDEQVKAIIDNPQPGNPNARIEKLNADANASAITQATNENVYNLTFKEIGSRLANTVHDILDDLVNFNMADGIRGFINIFTQSDRLIFVGMIIILITIAVMFFRTGDLASGANASGSIGGGGCCCNKHN